MQEDAPAVAEKAAGIGGTAIVIDAAVIVFGKFPVHEQVPIDE
jgi:hypothetical protein